MKRIVLTYGVIAGVIVSAALLIGLSMYTGDPSDYSNGMIIGYTSMIIAFALIFVAINKFKKENGGTITFGKAFTVGLLISLIASTFYVVSWMFYFSNCAPNFMEEYSNHVIEGLKQKGLSQIELDKKIADMKQMQEMYKNPIYRALITYVEILPIGLLVTLISSIILRTKNSSAVSK